MRQLLIGYLNRNTTQVIEVPIGPNNRVEPGGPDLGQPAVFLPGRQTGAFIMTVPKDFDPKQRVTWSITANGQTHSIPFWLNQLYEVNPWTDIAVGNKPPVIRFDPKGPAIQGPLAMVAKAIARTATMAAGVRENRRRSGVQRQGHRGVLLYDRDGEGDSYSVTPPDLPHSWHGSGIRSSWSAHLAWHRRHRGRWHRHHDGRVVGQADRRGRALSWLRYRGRSATTDATNRPSNSPSRERSVARGAISAGNSPGVSRNAGFLGCPRSACCVVNVS